MNPVALERGSFRSLVVPTRVISGVARYILRRGTSQGPYHVKERSRSVGEHVQISKSAIGVGKRPILSVQGRNVRNLVISNVIVFGGNTVGRVLVNFFPVNYPVSSDHVTGSLTVLFVNSRLVRYHHVNRDNVFASEDVVTLSL